MTTVRELVEGLERRELPPVSPTDPFSEAWASSADVDAMIDLLLMGGTLHVYEIGSSQTWGRIPTRWLFRLRTAEGRYVRVDVTREGGADALRAIFPEIATREQWAEAIARERRLLDPLSLLVADLRRTGRADPAWLARHSLPRLWRTTDRHDAMRDLLQLLGRLDLRDRAQDAIDRMPRPPRPHRGEFDFISPAESDREMAELHEWLANIIRAAVPEPPPLPGARSEPSPDDPRLVN